MGKVIHQSATNAKTVGVAHAGKTALYDKLAVFLNSELNTSVDFVAPKTIPSGVKGVKGKKTGSYGLLFEMDGELVTLELVVKQDGASKDDFKILATQNA